MIPLRGRTGPRFGPADRLLTATAADTNLPQGALLVMAAEFMFVSMGASIRMVSLEIPNASIVFYFALIGTLGTSLPLPWYWVTPTPQAVGWLLAIGLLATLGQLLLTRGLSLAAAARVGAFGFFAVVFGAFYGWLFWDELLRWTTLTGALLVICAGVAAGRSRGLCK